jgi:hypothetical protein
MFYNNNNKHYTHGYERLAKFLTPGYLSQKKNDFLTSLNAKNT